MSFSKPANDLAAFELEPLRFSRLKLMGRSAAHYEHGFHGESAAMRKGTGVHSFLIGDESQVVLFPGKVRNGKAWDQFEADHPGKTILNKTELGPVLGMRDAIRRHPRAMALLDGVRETRIEWETLGRKCAGTPDVVRLLGGGRKGLTELKTSVSSHPQKFMWQAKKLAYHGQCDWYGDGLERSMAYGAGPVDETHIVVVESTAPYPVTVIAVSPRQLNKGRRLNRIWLETLLGCERTAHFPGYVESDVTWDDEDDDAEQGGDGLDWGDAAE
jgi:hypothetical protein